MNYSIIRFIVGYVLRIESGMLLLPVIVGLIYGEGQWLYYLISAAICAVFGFALSIVKPVNKVFYLKEGCVSTALSWIALSIFGALPFVLTGEIPSIENALFETVSGLTTTGASILSDVEALSHASLFWRSFTHWIGGMGVLIFLMAILPMTGGSSLNLMRAESPGPDVGKLVPHMRETARILYLIYLGLTVIEIVILLIGGMPIFDTLTLSFGTAGTGGFGVRNDSIASYTSFQQWVITIFMILFGVNFNAYYYIIYKKFKKAFSMQEVKTYLVIILISIGIITISILNTCQGVFDAIKHAAFQVGSIITTTGYSTVDFDTWPAVSKCILVILMFCGACAGSTGGGIKVSRFIMLVKCAGREVSNYIHPKNVKKINFDRAPIPHETMRATTSYVIIYLVVFLVSIFIICFDDFDLETNFTAIAATFNNIGPGLGKVGPTQNFDIFSPLSKIVMIIDMLAGRLELFPLLILFYPKIWIDDITHRHHRSYARQSRNRLKNKSKQE